MNKKMIQKRMSLAIFAIGAFMVIVQKVSNVSADIMQFRNTILFGVVINMEILAGHL